MWGWIEDHRRENFVLIRLSLSKSLVDLWIWTEFGEIRYFLRWPSIRLRFMRGFFGANNKFSKTF